MLSNNTGDAKSEADNIDPNICIGVNSSERKRGTERTKKRKKRELVFFSPPGGAIGTVVHCPDANYSRTPFYDHPQNHIGVVVKAGWSFMRGLT